MRCHINRLVLMFYIFYNATLPMAIPLTLGKMQILETE